MNIVCEARSNRPPVSLTMIRPDDWHLHVRDGAAMRNIICYSARQFGRAIIMPNLTPPVTTTALAIAYRERILAALPEGLSFQPLMTLYLTDTTSRDEIFKAKKSGIIHAVKYYPANATTNSAAGVTDITRVYPALDEMDQEGIPLLIHGEVTDPNVDVYDREMAFLEILDRIRQKFRTLKIVLEHVTTEDAVEYVWRNDDKRGPRQRLAATITPHHLLENRNALFRGGIRPHNYCLPILKREKHRQALLRAATSGERCFFLGTDSAPHPQHLKENASGCAGCLTAIGAIEHYAQAFESVGKLHTLEGFASHFGPDFYELPRNTDMITLVREEWEIPKAVQFGDHAAVPFRAREKMWWKMI